MRESGRRCVTRHGDTSSGDAAAVASGAPMAATFFGEVVWSRCRAGTEDDDDEDDDEGKRDSAEDREVRRQLARRREVRLLRRQTKASLEAPLLEQHSCSTFIVAIGVNAVAFASSFIMNSGVWEEVARAGLWNEWCGAKAAADLAPAEASCVFYRLRSGPSVLLCQCSCYVAEDQQFPWLEKVFGSRPRRDVQVMVLTCRHVTDYKSPESPGSLPTPFLRALKTHAETEPPGCPPLEQPNIAHDLPAAVLSFCQVWKVPAVLYLCYTDVMKLDLLTAEAFRPALSSQSLRGLAQNVPQSRECLKRLTATDEVQSNIYT